MSNSHDHPVNEQPLKMAQNGRSVENLGLLERHVGVSVPTPLIERRSIRGSRDHPVNVYNRRRMHAFTGVFRCWSNFVLRP